MKTFASVSFVFLVGCVAPLETVQTPLVARAVELTFTSGRTQQVFVVGIDKDAISVLVSDTSTAPIVVPRSRIVKITENGQDVTLDFSHESFVSTALERIAEVNRRHYNLVVVLFVVNILTAIATFLVIG